MASRVRCALRSCHPGGCLAWRSGRVRAALLVAFVVSLLPVAPAAAGLLSESTASVCRVGCVDLSVGVSDGVGSLVPGRAVVYLVTVRNAGPSAVGSVVLTDSVPAGLEDVVFLPLSGFYRPGSHLWAGLSLGAGRSATMMVVGEVDPAATGTLVNALTVAPPAGVTEGNPANNSATDTDALKPQADLSVTKSDGATTVVAGRSTVYTVTVRNGGPSTVGSFLLTDAIPAGLQGVVFTPTAGLYSPVTHVWSGLSLAAGQSVTMTVTGTVDPAASGKLVNTVTVAAPAGVSDPGRGNNSATDADTVTAQADLSVTDSDGATTAVPGQATIYSVVVANAGPSAAGAVTVKDLLPAAVGSDSWTASDGTSGSGNINTTVALPAAGTVTYTVTANVSASASGTLKNTATVTAPSGVTDSNQANNSATDTDTLTPQADLAVSNDDGATAAVPGSATTYTIVVSNAGPSSATAAAVADTLPASVDSGSWTATASSGSSVAAGSGSGSIATTATLLPGGSATYTLVANLDASATGTLADTATVTAPAGVTDPDTGDNSATDTDSIGTQALRFGDLHLCNLPILPRLDGLTVRQFLDLASRRLGGVVTADPIADLDTIAADLNAAFDGTPTGFALHNLGTSTGCQPVPWQTGDLSTFTQADWVTEPAGENFLYNDFETVYAPSGELVVGDDAPGYSALFFDGVEKLADYLPASGTAAALDESLGDPTSTPAGVFGGDLTALQLNVDFDTAGYRYIPRTCNPPGTNSCPWSPGDVITYGPVDWFDDPAAEYLLGLDFELVYFNEGGNMIVGEPLSGYAIYFDGVGGGGLDGVTTYLPASGSPAALNANLADPRTTSAGVFGGDVTALQLDVDFSDAGYLVGASGLPFGDLTLCNLPSTDDYPTYSAALHDLDGMKVRDVLALAETALGGVPTTYSPVELDPLVAQLTVSFTRGIITTMSPYLFNGPCT